MTGNGVKLNVGGIVKVSLGFGATEGVADSGMT
jgi:hypothetical protein